MFGTCINAADSRCCIHTVESTKVQAERRLRWLLCPAFALRALVDLRQAYVGQMEEMRQNLDNQYKQELCRAAVSFRVSTRDLEGGEWGQNSSFFVIDPNTPTAPQKYTPIPEIRTKKGLIKGHPELGPYVGWVYGRGSVTLPGEAAPMTDFRLISDFRLIL